MPNIFPILVQPLFSLFILYCWLMWQCLSLITSTTPFPNIYEHFNFFPSASHWLIFLKYSNWESVAWSIPIQISHCKYKQRSFLNIAFDHFFCNLLFIRMLCMCWLNMHFPLPEEPKPLTADQCYLVPGDGSTPEGTVTWTTCFSLS